MSNECTEARFLNDVAKHEMLILRDDGVYRHVRFKRPGTSCMHFDLITWPGYLCYTGDMGTYVFQRLEDMFEFFRADRKYKPRDGKTLSINLCYWSEKLQAVDGSRDAGSAKEFDGDKFRRVINEYRVNWMRDLREHGANKDDRRELWEAVEHEVIYRIDDGEHAAQSAAYDFHHAIGKRQFYFQDLFEHSFTEYTSRFVWCCYALAWGIQEYDESKQLEHCKAEVA